MQRVEATPTGKWVCQPAGECRAPAGLHCSKFLVKLPFPLLQLRQLGILCLCLPFLRWRWKHYVGLLRSLGDVLTIKYFLVSSRARISCSCYTLYCFL